MTGGAGDVGTADTGGTTGSTALAAGGADGDGLATTAALCSQPTIGVIINSMSINRSRIRFICSYA
jgi:hypothetical protein